MTAADIWIMLVGVLGSFYLSEIQLLLHNSVLPNVMYWYPRGARRNQM
jgi:hypothetical protein